MDEEYKKLLGRTRVPQPSLQRYAVIQIFNKITSTSSLSFAAREAITECFESNSISVVEQAVRELCRLVKSCKIDVFVGLVELQSALEGCQPRFVTVFVKGIGFLVRFGFCDALFADVDFVHAPETHPFIKILTSRLEAQTELAHQVVLLVIHGKQRGIGEVCNYLRPLLTFSILRAFSSDSSLSSYLSLVIYSLTSLCCSLLHEANPILEMLIGCLRCFDLRSAEDFGKVVIFAEFLVDAYNVVLQHSVKMGLVVSEVQLIGVQLLDAILTLCLEFQKFSIDNKPVLELSKRLLSFQKHLELPYAPEFFSPMLSLFYLFSQMELEDEKLNVLDLLAFILKWRIQYESVVSGAACNSCEVFLFLFPVISFMSSPSKSVKHSVSQFLSMLEKLLQSHSMLLKNDVFGPRGSLYVSKPDVIMFKLLQRLWLLDISPSSLFLHICSSGGIDEITVCGSKLWISQLGEYASSIAERHKTSDSISSSEEIMSSEIPSLLGAIAGSLVVHESLGSYAIDTLAALGNMEPKLGVALLLAVLYYCNILRCHIKCSNDLLLKLLGMLSSLASNSTMIPLIFQTILPMLQKESDPVLYATGIRLLCKAWEMNDRVFGSLQTFVQPESFYKFRYNHTIATSLAASLRDICRINPERGIQLILSVEACLKSTVSIIRALGYKSLGYLCEADVIDFYTAWNVIAKLGEDYLTDPIVANSLSLLLRWGALDAEAYVEASVTILQILWNIGSSNCSMSNLHWRKARVAALDALNYFEVLQIERSIPDIRDEAIHLLIHETDTLVLQTVEELVKKMIAYEHSTRRRLVKTSSAPRSKIEKLVNSFPRVICSSGKGRAAKMMPGTALFQLSCNKRDPNRGKSRIADNLFGEYYNMMMDVAGSLYLSRNIVVALMSLQSWKKFMENWLKNYTSVLDTKASSAPMDKTLKAANNILKSMIKAAEDSIPRVAENIALAMGSFCVILPASVHPVKVKASKFLLSWLFQYEHEHRQWPAAIAVGVLSTFLHSTDRQQKIESINGLLEVACRSRNILVKGACGIGLGYSCQDLLSRAAGNDNTFDQDNFKLQEKVLLGKIVRALSLMIQQVTKITFDLLVSLSDYKVPGLESESTSMTFTVMLESDEDVGDDTWGVAGLVFGLGMSASALSKAGSYDAISNIKLLLTSWIGEVKSLKSTSGCQSSKMMLSMGACLVFPIVASFCRKVEMMHDNELNDLYLCYENVIFKLQLEKTSNIFHSYLLMASCAGAGSLLDFILEEGLIALDVQQIKSLLGLFKIIYSGTHHHLVHLGAFLGVVHAMGVNTGITFHHCSSKMPISSFGKESPHINGPLLSTPCFAEELLAIIQDIFLVALDSSDGQLQAYASWAIECLHYHILSKEGDHENGSTMRNSQTFPKDAIVLKLSTWLAQLDYSSKTSHVNTIAAVLRCLSSAPRLPKFDWGAIVQRCMKYVAHIAESLPYDSACEKKSLLKECLIFSLAHANKYDSLLSLLDELTSLFRFRTLDLITQSCLLFHLCDFLRLFSSSRTQMLLEDIYEYLSSPLSSYQNYNLRQKRFVRLSCWKGLSKCLSDASIDNSECLSGFEKCMELLFSLLSSQPTAVVSKHGKMAYLEWKEAIFCLGNARRAWLLDLLQIPEFDTLTWDDHIGEILKKMLAISQLVKHGSLPMTELLKLKTYMFYTQTQGMWELFVEIVVVLQSTEVSMRRQWLIDVLKISCMTKYPSKGLQFLGLFAGCFCKYMPFLVLDPHAVLVDLPVTLSSLLSSTHWRVVAEDAVSYLWSLTLRIYKWNKTLACEGEQPSSDIDMSEANLSNLLIQVLLDACSNLKEFLPLKDQQMLANMVVSQR